MGDCGAGSIPFSVLGIVGRRLVRRICPSCKTWYVPTQVEMSFYEESGGAPEQDFGMGQVAISVTTRATRTGSVFTSSCRSCLRSSD